MVMRVATQRSFLGKEVFEKMTKGQCWSQCGEFSELSVLLNMTDNVDRFLKSF